MAFALLGPLLVLWPLPSLLGRGLVGWRTALLTHRGGEGVIHLWSWVAAARAGRPFSFHSDWLNAPYGLDVQVIDPLHGLVYLLGAAVGGPAVGWGLVCWLGLTVGGIGALLLAREVHAPAVGRWVAVATGVAVPTTLAAVVDGITEGLGVGWVAVQLALLLRLGRTGAARDGALLAAAITAGVHTGAYNAIWMAFVDVPVGLWLLARRGRWQPVVSGFSAAVLSAPYLLAALGIGADRPGAGNRHHALPPPSGLQPWRGAWMEGADLLDLFVPAVLTGAASWPTTAYLGVALLGGALVGAWQWGRASAPWLLGVVAFVSLALGPFLVVAGHVTGAPTPAGLLELTFLGRLTRWYRAGAVAVLLLAPLAAWATARRPVALVLAALVLVDGRLGGPVPLRLPLTALPEHTALTQVSGPFAEQPAVFPVRQPGTVADLNLLLQVLHRQPTSGTIDAVAGEATVSPAMRSLQRSLTVPPGPQGQALARDAAQGLRALGYGAVVVYKAAIVVPGEPNVAAALGAPVAEDDLARVYTLGPKRR